MTAQYRERAASARDWLRDALAMPTSLRKFVFEGAEIACCIWNEADVHLPGMVLVHGFRGHMRWWDPIAPLLTATHRVAALDLSGMGDSGHRERYTRLQHGQEVLAVADLLGFDRAVIVAHSYGAVATLLAARVEPHRFGRLIAIDAGIPTADDVRSSVSIRHRKFYPSREAALQRFSLLPPGRWPDPDILAHIAWHSLRETAEGWIWKFDFDAPQSLNDGADYREAMFGVKVRCDFIFGELSELATPERMAQVPRVAPAAPPVTWIPAAHHHVMIEQPLALVGALRALLGK